ncbi:type II toxin-antitoxin system PemK/MazF family toxin [Schinkia azotoformans]|nr:type II toxin-antitoxin system PemK/MazF family toxin [Schinkia azotoformans]
MFVDYKSLSKIVDDDNNKSILSKDHEYIKSNMYPFQKKFMNFLETLSAYETASIIKEKGYWEKFKTKNSKWKYERRDIVLVNLGASNYGIEASYKHPCIIYANGYYDVFIIPCSTGRYKLADKSDYILKGEKSDGFKEPTGIQLDKIRFIDKTRIDGKILGKVTNDKFNEITNALIELYFNPVKKRIDRTEIDNKKLAKENSDLKRVNSDYEKENAVLKSEIQRLTDIINSGNLNLESNIEVPSSTKPYL